ncbi:MAG TPA: helix-turn-helix domain-containing protein [Ideonella sp.]|jgi:cytoskeleton protein RodZ|nr:helix-turn-helix domain-containing protein [Ideonella sp.]
MSEPGDTPDYRSSDTAGAMLRAARQAQGLHIAALATMLKVPPRKLEALESDRYEELQGATFVRALAQAACRALKIDPTPVLDLLPDIDSGNLSQLERGLNAPFRERGARRESTEAPNATRAVLGVVAVLLLGALAFLLVPKGWRLPGMSGLASAPASEAGSAAGVSESITLPTLAQPPSSPPASDPALPSPSASLPAPAPAPQAANAEPAAKVPSVPSTAASAPAVTAADGHLLQLRARGPSWIEVVDGRSQVLLARTLAPGEAVGFDGALPMRVRIGNVAVTEMSFRGRVVDLAAQTRDNVARVELK